MLSITQFPRRFPTASKRTLRSSVVAAASSSPSSGIESTARMHHDHAPAKKLQPSGMVAALTRGKSLMLSPTFQLNVPRSARFVQTTSMPRSPKGQSGSKQSFGTAASAVEDEYDDSYLYGERSDNWFTTSRNPCYDSTFPGMCPETHTLSSIAMPNLKTCTREKMLDYFDNTWALTDALFSSLQGEDAFTTPPPHQLRHPLIFYYGHPTVFWVNKFVVSGLLPGPVNQHFENIFEVGVDEMRWDDMSKNEMEWPTVAEVTEYRREVYGIMRDILSTHKDLEPGHGPIDERNELWAMCMALEHERIHLETSSMLMLEHPERFSSSQLCSQIAGVDYPVNEMLDVAGGRVTIGKPRDFPTFGWDNEYGQHEVDVPACKASKFMISNGEFWEFVSSGGYLEPSYWSQLGWEWRCFRNTKWPSFWVPDGPSGSHQYKLRAIFNVLPMQWDWPAQVNLHEAQAFCKWKNERDGNRDETVYHLSTEPIHQLIRDEADRSANTESDDILTIKNRMAAETGKNLNVSYMSFSPVDAMKPTQSGFHDVFGNAWEWCEDMFSALPGFTLHKYYDDFSAPCFDGEHHVIMGGSFISSGDNGASKFARYHFRPHFFQHAGFRVVAQPVDKETQTIRLVTTDINSPGPYVNTNPFRTSEVVPVNGKAAGAGSEVNYRVLFGEIHSKAERVLEAFVQSVGTAGRNTLLVRTGVEGAMRLKEQVKSGDTMVVVSSNNNDEAVVAALESDFMLVETSAVPMFIKESDTECRISVQTATAWQKK
uniref:Sulfatase-modifying factor enzyme domain-containing protein n=1 Tax=Globisporangium ultimum (strain ATCC 200006 / CBS 805.95 / DAOM BR144) TaxID=431595 RepID=K3X307_GLOUD